MENGLSERQRASQRAKARVRFLPLTLPVALIIAAIVRGVPVFTSDFPLHDGGLFYVMAEEIRQGGFSLPMHTAFNDAGIPFVYPPLGLYMVAVLGAVVDPIQLLRFLPFLYSLAAVAGVYVVTAAVLSRRHAAPAALAFALMPHAYDWMIVGGGVTRGLGLAVALFTIAASVRTISQPSARSILIAGAWGGVTLLTHPEATLFATVSTAVLWAVRSRQMRPLMALVIVAAVALAISSPWWLTVVSVHGVDVLADAAGSRQAQLGVLQRLLNLRVTGVPFLIFDVTLALGLVGLVRTAMRRRWLLGIWLLAAMVTVPAGGTAYITVPWAMLSAVTLAEVAVPVLRRGPRWASPIVLAAWATALTGTLIAPYMSESPIDVIPASDRAVMRHPTVEGRTIAILTGRPWWDEGPGEWFPAISRTPNVVIAQGYEWLGQDAFHVQRTRHQALQDCAHRSVDCVIGWLQRNGVRSLFVSSALQSDAMEPETLAADNRLITLHRADDTYLLELREASP